MYHCDWFQLPCSDKYLLRRKPVFYAFYAIAIVILVLHFTGWLKRNNLEWLMLVLAVAVFPAVIFLK